MKRKFELVSTEQLQKDFDRLGANFDRVAFKKAYEPRRATKSSAAYDLYCPIDLTLKPGEISKIPTGFKIKIPKREGFFIYIRSSLGIKDINLPAGVNIIDADYYNNESNEGHFFIIIKNNSSKDFVIEKGDRIAQGVFQKYFTCGDKPKGVRRGGFGSTKKK